MVGGKNVCYEGTQAGVHPDRRGLAERPRAGYLDSVHLGVFIGLVNTSLLAERS